MPHALAAPEFLENLRYDGLQITTLRALGEYRGRQQLNVARSPMVLRAMKAEGLIAPTGKGRGAKWLINERNR